LSLFADVDKNTNKMKEETKLILARVMIMQEKQLCHIEQDLCNEELSDREIKGLKVERKELLKELANTRSCFNWVCDV